MSSIDVPAEILDIARSARRVAVLTGAGMSAESGVRTFREPQTGLWEQYDPQEIASVDAWLTDTSLCWAWNLALLAAVRRAQPNEGHRALARWSRQADVRVVTQNVDDLHERAGSEVLSHLHGSMTAFRCFSCGAAHDPEIEIPELLEERMEPPICLFCGGSVRPGIVWFGEALPTQAFFDAVEAVRTADAVFVVGTSGVVYPAAALPDVAAAAGRPVIEINPQPTRLSDQARHVWRATAATALPALVDALEPGRLAAG